MKIYWYLNYFPVYITLSKSLLISVPTLHVFFTLFLFFFGCQNGPTQFVSGSKMPLPDEKHDETLYSAPEQPHKEQPDSDSSFDPLDFPEVPKVSLQPSANVASAPTVFPSLQTTSHPNIDLESSKSIGGIENPSHGQHLETEEVMQERSVPDKDEQPSVPVGGMEDRQFVPFISAPSLSSASFSVTQSKSPTPLSRTKSEANVDLQDVLAAAQAAAESAERAAAAARSAASLAQIRISELTTKNSDTVPENICENVFYNDVPHQSGNEERSHFDHHNSFGNSDVGLNSRDAHQGHEDSLRSEASSLPSLDMLKAEFDSSLPNDHGFENELGRHQPQRLTSMDDDPYFSYPNLFTPSQNPNLGSAAPPSIDNSRSTHEL